MSKTARALGTVGHTTVSIPLHLLLTLVTCGLWIPVWVYMSVQRKNRRQEERLSEKYPVAPKGGAGVSRLVP